MIIKPILLRHSTQLNSIFLIFTIRISKEWSVYPPELKLNNANTSDSEILILDLHLSISNGFVSSKIYDKRAVFDFDTVNFPFLDGAFPVNLLT